ncbi:hypothetical protein HPB48_017846 [Haemaphysalis longicornis]|uniref:Cuticle protein n=1 Tax=Haemaphysalis longicornis TaxID=44386 RepID=A0A9J6GB33_HAELO|nr:hypothetical protein HPB48_017846 [Haemaphysalis longicornis]
MIDDVPPIEVPTSVFLGMFHSSLDLFVQYRLQTISTTARYVNPDFDTKPAQPYSFGYDNVDEFGTKTYHKEQGDASNSKTGSFGYMDASGLFRRVNYVADAADPRQDRPPTNPEPCPERAPTPVFNSNPRPRGGGPLFVSVHGCLHLRRIRLRAPGPWAAKRNNRVLIKELSPCTKVLWFFGTRGSWHVVYGCEKEYPKIKNLSIFSPWACSPRLVTCRTFSGKSHMRNIASVYLSSTMVEGLKKYPKAPKPRFNHPENTSEGFYKKPCSLFSSLKFTVNKKTVIKYNTHLIV